MTDKELVKNCMEGKRDAQKLLFDRYAGKMLTVCKRYFDNTEEAEDALQEGFIKVFEKLHQWQASGPLGGWIRTIMVNTALTHLRTSKKWKDSTEIESAGDITSTEMDALASMSADELLLLIAAMPVGYRTVFNLFAIEGYAHKEIAEMLGISENTSKTQYLKSKDWLKKKLLIQEKEIEQSE